MPNSPHFEPVMASYKEYILNYRTHSVFQTIYNGYPPSRPWEDIYIYTYIRFALNFAVIYIYIYISRQLLHSNYRNIKKYFDIQLFLPYPSPVLAFGYCHRLRLWACVSVCVYQSLVRTITRRSLKLGSPKLDQGWQTPCFRCLLLCGMINLALQGQI